MYSLCMENMSDTQREAWIDRRVQRALSTDSRYVNAENAEEQADAEAAITREAEVALARLSGAAE
jgi:hypothetical protein